MLVPTCMRIAHCIEMDKNWKHSPLHELDAINSYGCCFCFVLFCTFNITITMPKHTLIEKHQHADEKKGKENKSEQKKEEEEDDRNVWAWYWNERKVKKATATHGPNFFLLHAAGEHCFSNKFFLSIIHHIHSPALAYVDMNKCEINLCAYK